MNLDPADNPLREKVWRRDLTAAEQAELRAWLAKHPEAQSDWADEASLNRLLDRLPDAPVPSNFTARVLNAVEREQRAQSKTKTKAWWLRAFMPRVAAGAVVAFVAVVFVEHQKTASQQSGVANSLAVMAGVESLPSPDALENFEVIRRLSPAPAPDEELLAVMK